MAFASFLFKQTPPTNHSMNRAELQCKRASLLLAMVAGSLAFSGFQNTPAPVGASPNAPGPAPVLAAATASPTTEPLPAQVSNSTRLRERLAEYLARYVDGNQAQLVSEFCREMTLATLPDYRTLLAQLAPETYGVLTRERLDLAIHQRWLELSPEDAINDAVATWDKLKDPVPGTVMTNKMAILLGHYAQQYPELAKRRYTLTTVESEQYALLEALPENDPEFVFGELAKFPDTQRRRTAVGRIVYRLVTANGRDAKQVSALVGNVKDPILSAQMKLHILSHLAERSSPGPILDQLLAIAHDWPEKNELVLALYQRWLLADSTAAAAWLVKNPPGLTQYLNANLHQLKKSSGPSDARAGTTR